MKKKSFCFLIVLLVVNSVVYCQNILSTEVSEDNSYVTIKTPVNMFTVLTYKGRIVDNTAPVDYDCQGDYYECIDYDIDLTNHSYTYIESYQEDFSDTMHIINVMRLTANKLNENKVRLTWNALLPQEVDLSGHSITYYIYKYYQGQRQLAQCIDSTTTLSYIDDISNSLDYDKICYYVSTKQDIDPSDIPEDTGYIIAGVSSTATISFQSIFFCPTAFAPKDGVNEQVRTFKPECHFVRYGSYSMKIYNRWGTLLFETSNPNEGWNGKYEDKYCPVGTYVYKIVFVDDEGMQQEKKGTFLLFD